MEFRNLWMVTIDKKFHVIKIPHAAFLEICDSNDLLAHTFPKLSDEIRVDSDRVPLTTTTGTRNKNGENPPDKKADQQFK